MPRWKTPAKTPSGYRSFEREAEQLDYYLAHPSPLEMFFMGFQMYLAAHILMRNPRFVEVVGENIASILQAATD